MMPVGAWPTDRLAYMSKIEEVWLGSAAETDTPYEADNAHNVMA